MLMLMNALLIETFSIIFFVGIPCAFSFIYEKFDQSNTAAALKRIAFNMPILLAPISDIIKLYCIRNYRNAIKRMLTNIFPCTLKLFKSQNQHGHVQCWASTSIAPNGPVVDHFPKNN